MRRASLFLDNCGRETGRKAGAADGGSEGARFPRSRSDHLISQLRKDGHRASVVSGCPARQDSFWGWAPCGRHLVQRRLTVTAAATQQPQGQKRVPSPRPGPRAPTDPELHGRPHRKLAVREVYKKPEEPLFPRCVQGCAGVCKYRQTRHKHGKCR